MKLTSRKEQAIFLQKKVKQVGLVSIVTLFFVVWLQISRSFAAKEPESFWRFGEPIFIGLASIFALLLFGIVVHLAYKILQSKQEIQKRSKS